MRYRIELMEQNGDWVETVGIYDTLEEVNCYCDEHPINEEECYYSIWVIECDENGIKDEYPLY